jgi:hypothetical protein
MKSSFFLDSAVINQTQSLSLTGSSVVAWFNTDASSTYQSYINNVACPMDRSSATYEFCLQDTILSQSSLLGQLTVQSSNDYQTASRFLSNKQKSIFNLLIIYFISDINPPQVSLVTPIAIETPYTSLLTIKYTDTLQNETYQFLNVTVDRTQSILVQIRDGNTSIPKTCSNYNTYYSCPFSYTNENRNQIQLT